MCRVYLLHRKAVEHHRTPKRKRNYRVRNRGHVLECGSVLPLWRSRSECIPQSDHLFWSKCTTGIKEATRRNLGTVKRRQRARTIFQVEVVITRTAIVSQGRICRDSIKWITRNESNCSNKP